SNNNTQAWNGNFTFAGTNDLDLGIGAVTLSANRTVTVSNGNLIVGGVIGGAFNLTKAGAGTLTLSGANTYTGLTRINAGTLAYGANDVIADTAAVTVSGGTLDIGIYSDTVGAVTLTSGAITGTTGVLSGSSYAVQSGTISAILGGSGNLTKTTTGTVIITNANTYTGITTVSAGVLDIQNALALGDTTNGTSVATGAALQLEGDITVVGEALTLNGTGISSGGALRNISGDNVWTGDITLGSASRVNSDSGTLVITGGIGSGGVNRNLTVGGDGNTSISGAIATVGGTLTKDGAGTLILSGANTYTGATTINEGVLQLNNAIALQSSTVTVNTSNGLQFGTGIGTFTIGALAGPGDFVLNAIDSSAVTLQVGGNNASTTYSGILSGDGALTKNGTGTFTLSGANTYTGGTTLNAGTLNINNAWAIGVSTFTIAGGTINNTSGGAITLLTANPQVWNANFTFTGTNDLDLGIGPVTLGADRTVTVSGSGNLTVGGVIDGAFNLTKAGTGTLTLSGANTYTGTTTINAGTLAYGANDVIADTGAVTVSGGTLDIGNFTDTVGVVTLTSGSITGAMGVLSGSSYDVRSGTITANLGGTGALTKTTTGTVNLWGTNTYSGGTNLNAGTLNINNASAIGMGTFTIAGGTINNTSGAPITLSTNNAQNWNANFTFTGTNDLDLGIGPVTLGANRTVTVSGSGNLTVGGVIDGAFNLTKAGTGTLTLSGANTYTGTTTINAGTLAIGANAPSGSAGALGNAVSAVRLGNTGGSSNAALIINGPYTVERNITVRSGSTGTATIGGNSADTSTFSGNITLNKDVIFTAAPGGTVVISGTVSGSSTVTKVGDGILQRSVNPLSLAGNFTISAGTFDANGEAVTVSGLTTVNGTGIYLASTGTQTFDGGLTVSDTGTFTGSSGTVDVTNLTVSDTATFTAPDASGALLVSGDWNIAGTASFIHNSGRVTFDGGGTSVLYSPTPFYDVTVDAGKALDLNGNMLDVNSLNNLGTITTSSGNLDITSSGNIEVGVITNAGGRVSLTSVSGAIVDNNGDDNNITANELVLSAANGIGDDGITQDTIETQVSSLQATNTNNGIWIVNTGSLDLRDIDGSLFYSVYNTNGWVKISANGSDVDNGIILNINDVVTAFGDITLEANNDVTVNEDITGGDYYDSSTNYATINVNNQISSTGGGNIELIASNGVNRTVTGSSNIGYYYDESYNYATINVNSQISANGGSITLLAKNDVDTTITIEGGIDDGYYDYSLNEATIYVNYGCGFVEDFISTTGSGAVSLTAENTCSRDITADYIYYVWLGDYDYSYGAYGYPYNHAYIDVDNAEINSDSGDITISVANTVDTSIQAEDGVGGGGIYDYEDYSENYAYIDIYNNVLKTISTAGNITLTATNSINSDSTSNVTADYIGYYDDESCNYAEVYVQDTVSTTAGDINITATNSVKKDVTTACIDYYYYDCSYNYAYIYVEGVLDARSGDPDNPSSGIINLSATNTVDSTLTVADYISYYYWGLYGYSYNNYAGIDLSGSGAIYSDSGDITVTAKNDVSFTTDTDYIGDFYNVPYNEADIYLYIPIYSQNGSVKLEARNIIDTAITADNGGISNYYEYDEGSGYSYCNYAYIDVDNTISTKGHADGSGGITLTASNTFTRNIATDGIGYFDDYYTNGAYIDIYGNLTTTQVYDEGEGGLVDAEDSTGKIDLSTANDVTDTVTVDGEPYDYAVGSQNDDEIYIPGTVFSARDVTMTAQDITLEGSLTLSPETLLTVNGNLAINGTLDGTDGNIDINGDINIAGGTLTAPASGAFTISGDWTNSGTFDANGGTVTFDGTDTSIISGSTTFNNFTCTTAGKQLTFEAGSTQTIEGALTLTGSDGSLIVLRSTTDGTQWNIDPQGTTRDVDYVDVQDSNNSNALPIVVNNYIDSGNNTNWTFYVPSPVTPVTVLLLTTTQLNQLSDAEGGVLNPGIGQISDYTANTYIITIIDASHPTFFFYHPLTPVDSSAFDSIVLDAGAYEFIENLLKLNGTAPSYFGINSNN
ncbi:MAG: autotransporter-associated beta strand repeat-containing protein, partial [Candidatus Omnitrophica bacterium]|nr:autotransporter-associated beta strand repeat-containing protein [Candidatus Omnitrophota bacterium]